MTNQCRCLNLPKYHFVPVQPFAAIITQQSMRDPEFTQITSTLRVILTILPNKEYRLNKICARFQSRHNTESITDTEAKLITNSKAETSRDYPRMARF